MTQESRQRIIAGNWKMNGSHLANHTLLEQLIAYRKKTAGSDVECIVFPPVIYLEQISELLKGSSIQWGTQNVSQYGDAGAYTGEVSMPMLKEFGCTYVLAGHSERRTLFGETNAIVAQKFKAIQDAYLTPILCVGETLAEREAGQAEAVLAEQLSVITDWDNSVIAYEPVWAIGTGKTATPEQAQAMHVWIREYVAKIDPENAAKISILYGGSVKGSNAATLFTMPDINGALVGGASLIAEEFIAILEAA